MSALNPTVIGPGVNSRPASDWLPSASPWVKALCRDPILYRCPSNVTVSGALPFSCLLHRSPTEPDGNVSTAGIGTGHESATSRRHASGGTRAVLRWIRERSDGAYDSNYQSSELGRPHENGMILPLLIQGDRRLKSRPRQYPSPYLPDRCMLLTISPAPADVEDVCFPAAGTLGGERRNNTKP